MKWLAITSGLMIFVVSVTVYAVWLNTPDGPRRDTVLVGKKSIPVNDKMPSLTIEAIRESDKTKNQIAEVVIVDEYARTTFSKTLIKSDTLWSEVRWSGVQNANCGCY